jgi:hypothetical protein
MAVPSMPDYGQLVGSPTHRLKDKSDVVELIKNRKLPRELPVVSAVKQFYLETWDALRAEENPLL